MKNLIISILLLFVMFGCQTDEQKVVYSYHENGGVKEEITFKENEPNKQCIYRYYENGTLNNVVNMKDGKREGICTSYFKNGQKHEECFFSEGKQNGNLFVYREDGSLYIKRTYINDLEHGITRFYNKENIITEEYLYIHDKPLVYKEFYSFLDTITNEYSSISAFRNHRINKAGEVSGNGNLVYSTIDNKPINNESLYYYEKSNKDTISIEENYSSVIYLANGYKWNLRLELGEFNKELNFIPEKEFSSDSTIELTIKPKHTGLNLVTGLLHADIQTIIHGKDISAKREYIFYTEFYVEE